MPSRLKRPIMENTCGCSTVLFSLNISRSRCPSCGGNRRGSTGISYWHTSGASSTSSSSCPGYTWPGAAGLQPQEMGGSIGIAIR